MRKESVMKLGVKVVLLEIASIVTSQTLALAGGTVTTCDEASLRAALVGGGNVTSSNLAGWFPAATNIIVSSNLFEFRDPTMESNRSRFYRTVSP